MRSVSKPVGTAIVEAVNRLSCLNLRASSELFLPPQPVALSGPAGIDYNYTAGHSTAFEAMSGCGSTFRWGMPDGREPSLVVSTGLPVDNSTVIEFACDTNGYSRYEARVFLNYEIEVPLTAFQEYSALPGLTSSHADILRLY